MYLLTSHNIHFFGTGVWKLKHGMKISADNPCDEDDHFLLGSDVLALPACLLDFEDFRYEQLRNLQKESS